MQLWAFKPSYLKMHRKSKHVWQQIPLIKKFTKYSCKTAETKNTTNYPTNLLTPLFNKGLYKCLNIKLWTGKFHFLQ